MEEFDYDAVIVGAGPIGGYLAQKLAKNNLRVLILEEHQEIGRPFQCAGLVNPKAMFYYGGACYSGKDSAPLGQLKPRPILQRSKSSDAPTTQGRNAGDQLHLLQGHVALEVLDVLLQRSNLRTLL